MQALAVALREAFGQSDQEMTTVSLEQFFELKRGRLSLQERCGEDVPLLPQQRHAQQAHRRHQASDSRRSGEIC